MAVSEPWGLLCTNPYMIHKNLKKHSLETTCVFAIALYCIIKFLLALMLEVLKEKEDLWRSRKTWPFGQGHPQFPTMKSLQSILTMLVSYVSVIDWTGDLSVRASLHGGCGASAGGTPTGGEKATSVNPRWTSGGNTSPFSTFLDSLKVFVHFSFTSF